MLEKVSADGLKRTDVPESWVSPIIASGASGTRVPVYLLVEFALSADGQTKLF